MSGERETTALDELVERVDAHLDELRDVMRQRGIGSRLGFGSNAAVLVVDLINAFTKEGSPLASDLDAEVEATRRILEAARKRGVPVIFSTSYYDRNMNEAGVWNVKVPWNDLLREGSEWVQVDARLEQAESDMLLVKKYASCFFGTDLASRLVSRGVDTLIITGATTSGCVRASAVDSCSLGFRSIVVKDAVGDRSPLAHAANLFDLEMKYADVVDSAEVIDYLEAVAPK